MTNFKNIFKSSLLAVSLITAVSCSKDEPEHIHDHEGIHEVEIKVTEKGTTTKKEYDVHVGETGETIELTNGKTYEIEIVAVNNDENKNILSEIIGEKDEHFFVYATTLTGFTFGRTDTAETTRTDGKKMGVKVEITVNEAQANRQLEIVLKHQATSVDDTANSGLGSTVGGATDLTIAFPVVVK